MGIATKLPMMNDTELATLHGNTKRLSNAGTPAQQSAAAALMPSITAELEARTSAATARRAKALVERRASKIKTGTAAAGIAQSVGDNEIA